MPTSRFVSCGVSARSNRTFILSGNGPSDKRGMVELDWAAAKDLHRTMGGRHTLIVDRYRKAATEGPAEGSYKGLRMHALPGLHEFIATKAVEHFEPGATLLDVAAGSGAMSLRMQDLGFKVSATDYVPENFRVRSVPFTEADLNDPFSSAFLQRFQAIIASEIIEHLENPRHFARECHKILEPGGRLVLSTPNVAAAVSRAMFVRYGWFLWFSDENYAGEGHITPLTPRQIHDVFAEAGFRLRWEGSFGKAADQTGGWLGLKLLTGLVTLIAVPDSRLSGEIYVGVMEKPKPWHSAR
jgi:2-polyprenyl-3-methyl-5-hydroxy-6-metoxy-1,4-benzoquinol methylase